MTMIFPPIPSSSAPVSLKERQRQERAELILAAADTVLAERGYHDTSMEEIAKRVGIAKGTIYLHFESKDDLLLALFTREMTAFQQAVREIVATEESTRAKLEAIVRFSYTRRNDSHRQIFLSFYTNLIAQKGGLEKVLALREHMVEPSRLIRGLLEAGKAAGELSRAIPTGVMLTIFLELLSPRGYEEMLDEEQQPPAALAAHVSHIFFDGITASDFAESD
jgi:TetR/AcrR family transcriptional regulator, fatty acid metabolism regulator protein